MGDEGGGDDEDGDGGPPCVAFVLTATAPALDPAAIVRAYARLRRGAGTLTLEGEEESVATFTLAGQGAAGALHVARVPAPIPGDEVEQAAALSVDALGREPPALAHAGHLIVMFHPAGEAARVDLLRALTLAAAAVAEACAAVGVYWGPGGVAHARETFVSAARRLEREPLPLPVWCGLSIAADGDERLSLLTVGAAAQLDVPDLLLSTPRVAVGEGVGFCFDLLLYVLRRGAPIAEGETVGRAADEELVVRYVDSPVEDGARVASLRLPG